MKRARKAPIARKALIGGALLVILAATLAAKAGGAVHPITLYLEPSQQNPRAGHPFVALVILDIAAPSGFRASCGGARIGRKSLAGTFRYFNGPGRNAAVCSWNIPAGTIGKKLYVAGAWAEDSSTTGSPHTYTWNIR